MISILSKFLFILAFYNGCKSLEIDESNQNDSAKIAAVNTAQGIGTSSTHPRIEVLTKWPERPFLIHVPESIQNGTITNFPVVFSLHGARSNALEQQFISCDNGAISGKFCLDELADRKNFLVVYPSGTKIRGGVSAANTAVQCSSTDSACSPRRWFPGAANCTVGEDPNLPDAGVLQTGEMEYFSEIIKKVFTDFAIDQKRVYIVGHSNGAAMAFELGCARKDIFAAVAMIAGVGSFPKTCNCTDGARPDLLQMHGTGDPAWPYTKIGPFFKEIQTKYDCKVRPTTLHLPDSDKNDGTMVSMDTYQECKAGDFVHYKIKGGGHTWPGGYLYSNRVGLVSRDINASEIIWNFFKSHSM